jgi:hypothetical protein
MISIWFFVGCLLTIYGALILIAGIREYSTSANVAMQNLHLQIWWGIGLLALGLLYTFQFRPGRLK